MIPIIQNPSQTVGLMDGDNPKEDFHGTFNPLLLKEWIESIIEHFGSDDSVCIAFHSKNSPCSADPNCTAVMLAASTEVCDSLQVCVCGYNNDDELGLTKKEPVKK